MQEALLEVLCDARHPKRFGIGAAEIGKRMGVYRDKGAADMNDAIVTGLLNQLHEQEKVVQADQTNGRGGWRLTEAEYKRRRD